YFKERSGLTLLETGRLRAKSLPYNFNYKKNCVLNFPQELPPVKDYEFIYRAADKIREAVSVFQGRIVVLCTSYRQLNILQQELENDLAQQGVTLLVQGSEPRNALIEKMRSSSHNVLLGVSSFWEGIDIRGENLSCLIMIKLPFAVPTEPLYEARVEKMIQEGRNAFFEYSVPLAVIKFKQGFGRLIRSDNDKGLFLVLDKRLLTKAYGQAFLKALPDIAYQPRESLADSAARIFRKN
ncbi:MAG TPA: helicase C-terminal domain-containing protein, partial [Spirochaetota bacterium]|nr:helicase C-terminal domain-containing protein [Spirochaetota bacterium]